MNNNYVPNTSPIPNILFDYWMHILSPAEFKVLMCIARKTYGWHKNYDRISISQIEKMTNLSRKGITKNIECLIAHGLVNKIKSKTSDGDDAPNQYEINVNCMGGGSELSTLGVVNSVHQGVVYSVHPQKKTYTKETLQNNNIEKSPQKEIPKSAEADEEISKNSSNEKAKKIRPISDFPPKVQELAEQMIKVLIRNKPNYSAPRNLSPFLTHVDYLLRRDNRDPQLVIDVFSWAVSDHFWADKMYKPNPAEYLRKQFDQLEMKMNAKPAPTERKFAPCSNDARSLEKMEEWAKGAL